MTSDKGFEVLFCPFVKGQDGIVLIPREKFCKVSIMFSSHLDWQVWGWKYGIVFNANFLENLLV